MNRKNKLSDRKNMVFLAAFVVVSAFTMGCSGSTDSIDVQNQTEIRTETSTSPCTEPDSENPENNSETTAETKVSEKTTDSENKEAELRKKAESYGGVYAWEYHDYDGDGNKEAFAAIGSPASMEGYVNYENVCFVDYQGNAKLMNGNYSAFLYLNNKGQYNTYNNQGFFWTDMGYAGSGWTSVVYSVKNGEPYELNISGEIQGFYQDSENGEIHTTENDLSGSSHNYSEIPLAYADGEFYKQISQRNEASETIKSVETAKSDSYDAVLENYKKNIIPNGTDDDEYSPMWRSSSGNPDDYGYVLHDLNKDGQDELFVLNIWNDSGLPMDIYTIFNGTVKRIATGHTRSAYSVLCGDGVLKNSASNGASHHTEIYYHLIDGKLVAFERFDLKDYQWYHAEGDGCDQLSVEEIHTISDDEIKTGFTNTINGIESLVLDNYKRFSELN